MPQATAQGAPVDGMAEKLCQRCLLLTFDTGAIIDAPPPQHLVGRDDLDLDEYGIVPLKYVLDDVLPELPELGRSIAAGCRMCLLLKNVLITQLELTTTTGGTNGATGSVQLRLSEFHPDLGTVQFTDRREDWLPSHIYGELRIGTTSRPISVYAKHRTDGRYTGFPDPNSLSDQSIKRMKTYLDICVKNHDQQHSECRYAGRIAAPLRLLNIQDTETVRLEETDGKNLEYAILSYCWGPARSVFDSRTVLANLPGRLVGFPADSLPATIQDSIALAHRLGATYIWIDALCICQDSGEWIYESQKMMQYYEMASFTITPIDSSGAEQGFLRKRPGWVSDVIAWPGSYNHLRFSFPDYKRVSEAGPATSSPWASRGWTFQERLLSSRLIFIGQDEVVFRCRAGYGRHGSKPPIVLESLGSYFLPLSPDHVANSNDWNNVEMILTKWYPLIGEYSERSLTKQSDKLIALSGIASKTHQLLGSQERYLDGFWESDLWHGLTWRRVTARGRFSWPTVKSDAFPTWSWCCMNQPLAWQDGTGSVNDVRLVDIIREGTGLNEKIKRLVLESWVFPIQVLATELPKDIEIDFFLDSISTSSTDLFKLADMRVVLLTAYLDGDEERDWKKNPTAKPHDAYGLVVEPTGETYGGNTIYRRLGTVDILLGLEFTPMKDEEYSGEGLDQCLTSVQIKDFERTAGVLLYQEMYSQKEVLVLA
ncbi:HET-domain-containing [Fusarium albosuccineum]|uniref:HET-domain-containing n=1 Tax=Fusarium albosuccineum TaxID=1237068 RepID=A0A8H4LHP2_9HYPO|nr:HET-domain-containing [Fusarium albosuccineum]